MSVKHKALCINSRGVSEITDGLHYLIKESDGPSLYYEVYDLSGSPIGPYRKARFEIVETPVVPPAPPAPPAADGTGVGTGMKYDGGKPRMDLLLDGCPAALLQVAEVLTFGAKKYAAHSWHTVSEGKTRYKAALLRHLTAHAQGEVNDPESGLPHLAHAACCSLFILELEQRESK